MKLIMENWRKFLFERPKDVPDGHRESISFLIGVWIKEYMKNKTYIPSRIKISSIEDEEKSKMANVYKGDNAYFEVLSNLIQIRDRIQDRQFNVESIKEILIQNDRPDVEAEFSTAIRYVGEWYRTRESLSFEEVEALISRGINAKISWKHDIESKTVTKGQKSSWQTDQKQYEPQIT